MSKSVSVRLKPFDGLKNMCVVLSLGLELKWEFYERVVVPTMVCGEDTWGTR